MRAFAFACGSVAVGCASMETVVAARASRDFSCRPEQIVITDVVGEMYRVAGCGSSATYNCQETSALVSSCMLVPGTQSIAVSGTDTP